MSRFTSRGEASRNKWTRCTINHGGKSGLKGEWAHDPRSDPARGLNPTKKRSNQAALKALKEAKVIWIDE